MGIGFSKAPKNNNTNNIQFAILILQINQLVRYYIKT